MEYLHRSAVGSHGRLSSYNCLLDAKWTIRISDYGNIEGLFPRRMDQLPLTQRQLQGNCFYLYIFLVSCYLTILVIILQF